MKEEPLLTRQSYRKQKTKSQRQQLDEIARKIRPQEKAERVEASDNFQKLTYHVSGTDRYNRFLNRWIMTMIVIFAIVLLVQFLL